MRVVHSLQRRFDKARKAALGRKIARTGLFDATWYQAAYKDVAAGGIDPLRHYAEFGTAEGRHPNPLFDPARYLLDHPEAAARREHPLLHYGRHWRSRGGGLHPFFDGDWYLQAHPEARRGRSAPLAGALGRAWRAARGEPAAKTWASPLGHYLSVGAAMGLEPSPFFARHRAAGLGSFETVLSAGSRADDAAIDLVVYTCVFGPEAHLSDPPLIDRRVRYLAFTDNPALESGTWELHVVRDALSSARRTALLPKLLAHRYLPTHGVSIYIEEPGDLLAPDLIHLAHDALRDCDLALAECLDAAEVGPAGPAALRTDLLIRRSTPEIGQLNEAWWRRLRGVEDGAALAEVLQAATPAYRQARLLEIRQARPLAQPVAETPRLFIFIAYAPSGYNGDLGRAYNDYMASLGDRDWALFLDHDALFCHPGWRDVVTPLLRGYAGQPVLFIARTNRIGMAYQRVSALEGEHRIFVHRAFAEGLAAREGDWTLDVTHLPPASGVMMLLNKTTWETNRFAAGFLAVDNRFHRALRAKGGRILMPRAAYVYHFYRADGDQAHAVRLPKRIVHSADDHPVRTFVFDEASGPSLAEYLRLLPDDGWAVFLRNGSMFGEKHWYGRACELAATPDERQVIVFNNSRLEGREGSDDVLAHRRLAGDFAREHGSDLTPPAGLTDDHFVAFMMSGRFGAALGLGEAPGTGELRRRLETRGEQVPLARGIYVFAPETTTPSGEDPTTGPDAREITASAGSALARRARHIGIVIPWPHGAGMDPAMHELAEALTAAGDLVTMFSPKPRTGAPETAHVYILRRHHDGAEFREQFGAHQAVFPFDLIIAEDPHQSAAMALGRKRIFGFPVVVRLEAADLAARPKSNGVDQANEGATLDLSMMDEADCLLATEASVAEQLRALSPGADIRLLDETSKLEGEGGYDAVIADLLSRWRPWDGPGKRLV